MNDLTVTDILINNFATEKSLKQIQQDYEHLKLMVEHERAATGNESRRLAALNVLSKFQLKLVLEKLVETPDQGGESARGS
jgi:hypothetical protein